MNRIFVSLALFGLLLSACASSPTTAGPSVGTIVAATMQALTAAAPQPTVAPPTATLPSGISVSFENVSFIIPSGLALGANAEAVPAVTGDEQGPWGMAPAHVRFTFYGYYNVTAKFSVMEIAVYPAQEYAAINYGAGNSLPRLQAILAASAAPIDPANLPRVPFFNAGPLFSAQVNVIEFASGSGVREVTQYGQAVGPAANNATFYHFEGLTRDGQYYIIVVLPVGAPFLVNPDGQFDLNDPNVGLSADGVPFPGYTSMNPADYEDYFGAVADKLNASAPEIFSPSLTLLDALIQSITVTP
jgi:hypothetical protein